MAALEPQTGFMQVRAECWDQLPGRMPHSVPSVLADENVSVNVLVGSFGAEGALVADVGQRKNIFTLAGTQDVQARHVLLVATSEQPLIGEEVFAGGGLPRCQSHAPQ